MGLYSVSWIVVFVVILHQQMHVSANDRDEEACSNIGIDNNGWFKWLNMPKELSECKTKMNGFFRSYTKDLVFIITEQLGKTYNQNKNNSEKYEEIKHVLELFKGWDTKDVESTLNGTIHLVYAGGVKNIDRLIEFATKQWWGNVFPKEGVKKTRVTNFNASLIIDRLLKKERFKTTFTHALKWLDEGKNCDEYAMMELLEYEAERIERNYDEQRFFDLFNAACDSKTVIKRWTDSALSEMIKHKSMYKMRIDLVINLLKVHRQMLVGFIQTETSIWTPGDIAIEMGRCNDTACIQLTKDTIDKALTSKISPNVYRKLYTYLHGQLIAGDKICNFFSNAISNIGTTISNTAEDDIVEYLVRIFHLKPWDSNAKVKTSADLILEKFLNLKWNLTDRVEFLRLAAKYDFKIEEDVEFLNLVGVTAPTKVFKAQKFFGKWQLSNANFKGIWQKLKSDVSNLWDIIHLLEPAETQQLSDEIEITIKIYFENYNNIKLCSDLRIFKQVAEYQDKTKFIDTNEKRLMLINGACKDSNGFSKLYTATTNKTKLDFLMGQYYNNW